MKLLDRMLKKENLLAQIVAVIGACCLWVYVMTEQNPVVERNVEVALRQLNLSGSMMVFNIPEKIMVKVRGTRTQIGDGLEQHIFASINLKNITEGQQSLSVNVVSDRGEVVSVTPHDVSFYADTVSEKTVPVIARIVGAGNSDMTIGSSVITPSEVTLRGATHRIDRVNKVVAPVDVSNHSSSFSMESELVAVSDDGSDIPNMKIIPERVMVSATMVNQLITVELPVKLVMSGQLPEGVVVKKTEIVPSQIEITAPPSLLKEMKDIKTKPVNLSNISGSTILAAQLDLPEKIVPSESVVQIKISAERQKDETKN